MSLVTPFGFFDVERLSDAGRIPSRSPGNSRYGLSGAVWAADTETAIAFARRPRTGAVDVNGGRFNVLAPFGG